MSTYTEVEILIKDIKFCVALPDLRDPQADEARREVIAGIVRVLSTAEVYAVLTVEAEKCREFLGGMVEVIAQARRASFWTSGDVDEVVAELLRAAARKGRESLYGRQGSMDGATVG